MPGAGNDAVVCQTPHDWDSLVVLSPVRLVQISGSSAAFGGELPYDPDHRANDGAYPQEMQGGARHGQRDTQDHPDNHQYKCQEDKGMV
jgi:hypothetical protein